MKNTRMLELQVIVRLLEKIKSFGGNESTSIDLNSSGENVDEDEIKKEIQRLETELEKVKKNQKQQYRWWKCSDQIPLEV